MVRRNQRTLETAVESAIDVRARAKAYYDLGVFHDNNNREAVAIPYYERALALGLDRETMTKCLAWLASSLCKTGRFSEAMTRIDESAAIADDYMKQWLDRLRSRVIRAKSN